MTAKYASGESKAIEETETNRYSWNVGKIARGML